MAAVSPGAIVPRCTTRCRRTAVSPYTVSTPPIVLSESVLGWLRSGVVAPDLLSAKKVRTPRRRCQDVNDDRNGT